MRFFNAEGYIIYAVSSIAAFVSGLMPFLVLAGAAAFAGASDNWTHLFELALGIWALSFLVPVVLIASRFRFAPWFAIVGSSAMVLYCAYCALIAVKQGQNNPVLVGKTAIPIWLWFVAPIPFNAIQAAISFARFRELGPLQG